MEEDEEWLAGRAYLSFTVYCCCCRPFVLSLTGIRCRCRKWDIPLNLQNKSWAVWYLDFRSELGMDLHGIAAPVLFSELE
jgi:hypothetical protein